jgi:hypothetical protein
MLYFLYSNQITFTPPSANFVVELVKKQSDSAVDLRADEEATSGASRRDFLLKDCKKSEKPGEVEPASPHAVYKLADKLDLDELKVLAKKAIMEGFTVENVSFSFPFFFFPLSSSCFSCRSSTNSSPPSPTSTTRSSLRRSTLP